MKIKQTKFIGLIGGVLLLIACGGGGGGTPVPGPAPGPAPGPTPTPIPTPLATGTFIKSFGPTDDGSNSQPFDATRDAKIQLLYTAAEINGSGNISALRFRRSTVTSAADCPNTTIRLGHTSFSVLTTAFGNNVEQGKGSLVTVLDDATVTIPAGAAASWFEIPVTADFYYNGEDNLVVEVERTTVCSAIIGTDTYTAATHRRAVSTAIDSNTGIADHNPVAAGATDAIQNWAQFVFAGGDNALDFGGTTPNSIPFNTGFSPQKVQLLYLASEIVGAGPVTGIGFPVAELTTAQDYTVTITLGHTSMDETNLGITYADNFDSGSPVTVADAVVFSVPADVAAGDYVWLPLTGSNFSYNGTDNLLVQIVVTDNAIASNDTPWETTDTSGIRRIVGNGNSGFGGSITHHMKFRFHGGVMAVTTTGSLTLGAPFSGSIDNTLQIRYGAHHLGTAADITALSLRLDDDSIAEEYTGYSVVMSHTANDVLSETLADNLDDPVTVFSGTFNIPAGLKMGDWVDIPVAGFSYDPSKNLLIQVTQNAGTGAGINSILAGENAGSGLGVADLGSLIHSEFSPIDHADIQLRYTKY